MQVSNFGENCTGKFYLHKALPAYWSGKFSYTLYSVQEHLNQSKCFPRLRSQTESRYVQTVPDGKCLCPDRPRRKVPMSRLSCVHQTFVRSCPDFRAFTRLSCVHVQTFVSSCPDFRAFDRLSCVHQTFVRSPDFRAFMSRPSCVHQTFVRSCPDFRAFTRLSCVHVQTFVSSCPDFRAFDRLSCVHQTFVRSPDFRAFMSRLSCVHQTFVRSCPDFRAFMSRVSCVRQTFVRSPDFRAFTRLSCVHQTFVRSPDFRAFMSRLLELGKHLSKLVRSVRILNFITNCG